MTTAYPGNNFTSQRSHARCPGCNHTFFVSAAQLKQGNGFVRCGRCLKLFFGDDLLTTPAHLSPTVHASPAAPLVEKTAAAYSTTRSPFAVQPRLPASNTAFGGLCPPTNTASTQPSQPTAPVLDAAPAYLELAPLAFDNNYAQELFKKKTPSTLVTATPDPIVVFEEVIIAEPKCIEPAVAEAVAAPTATPAVIHATHAELPSFTAFASDDTEELPRPSMHQPEKVFAPWLLPQQIFHKTINFLAYLLTACGFWIWQQLLKCYHWLTPRAWLNVASISAVLLLVANGIWWQRDKLADIPAVRPGLEAACRWMSCTLPPYKDPQRILVENRVLESHPSIHGGLRLHAIIRNESPFPQPFANVSLRFLDQTGHEVAEREFKPQDYVEMVNGHLPLMPPHTPIQLTLDMPDPGKQATGYMLAFQ